MDFRPQRSDYSSRALLGYLPVGLALAVVWAQSISFAQVRSVLKLDTGKEIFEAACAGCHGLDGKGQPSSTLGFEPNPATFPDFTDCSGSTRESTLQWSSVIHDGGHARAFSDIMPSFGPPESPALTDEQIAKVITYARTFCAEDSKWPSGDFNFARPMFTEKSFPEDEIVLMTLFNENGNGITHNLIVEKRLGAVTNLEFRFRGGFKQQPSGSWIGAVGDTSIEFKRTMFLNNKSGTMLAWGNEAILPTGDPARGQGSGITQLESFLSYGQILPKLSYFQGQVGIEGPPFHRHQSSTQLYWRATMGKAISQSRGFGRTWTPAVEFVGTRALGPRKSATLDFVPQMQVTLSRRQHMRLGMGVDLPVINKGTRVAQVIFYLLWDTFDGGLTEGWR